MEASPPAEEQDAATEAAGEETDLANLGVLLVHGIGEQSQGSTLTAFAEPIMDWVRSWLGTESVSGGRHIVLPTGGALRPPLLSPETPAHGRVLMGAEREGEKAFEEWLFAEAWWAPQVLTPPIADFTAWLLTRGPWLLLFHFNQEWLATPRVATALKIVLSVPISVVWLVSSLLINALLLAASLIALIPVGRVRQAVYALLRSLAGVVGDSYVLISSPMQGIAFEEATLRALRWLRPRCRRLAVIAHSQGAAIAHRTLQRGDAPPVEMLVTVGAGITKLEALRYFERLGTSDRICALLAPLFLIAAATVWLRARALGLEDVNIAVLALGGIGLGALLVTWMTVRKGLTYLRANSARLAIVESQPNARWVDIVATHDPVPAGKLSDYFDLPKLEAHSIPVLRSRLNDHTSYWRARASFIPLIVEQLAICAAGPLLEPVPLGQQMRARATRRLNVDLWVLRVVRLLDLAALALPFVIARGRVVSSIDRLRLALARPADPGGEAPLAFIDGALAQMERMLTWVTAAVTGDTGTWAHPFVNALAAAALMGSALLLWQRLTFGMWRAWSAARNAEAPRQRSGQSFKDHVQHGATSTFLNLGFATMLLLPLVVSVAWSLESDWLDEARIYRLVAQLAGIMFMALMALGFLEDLSERLKSFDKSRNERRSRTPTSRALIAWLSWPLLHAGVSRVLEVMIGAAVIWVAAAALVPALAGQEIPVLLVGLLVMARYLLFLLDGSWRRLEAAGGSEFRKALMLLLPPLLGIGVVAALVPSLAQTGESPLTALTAGVIVSLIAAGVTKLWLPRAK